MSYKKTFSIGGVHLDKHKISSHSSIVDAGIPEIVYIPVKQHKGSPAKILVKRGDKVKVGTLIADADGIVSADVHSSVSGEVIKVEAVEGDDGYQEDMITIKVEGDVFEPSIDTSLDIKNEISYTAEEIIALIRSAGIVGMGGAGYPTPIKTTIPDNKKAQYLIVNGIECEPYLTADDRLMIEKSEEIVIGAKIINKILGIQNAIIAIDENKPEAIAAITKATKTYVGVNVKVFESKYPQGAEKQLIEAVTGREVLSGKLPIDTGCIVQNVGTIFAIYEAVIKHKPLYERIITVSGDDVVKPTNFRVRVGTPASFLINQVGIKDGNIGKIIFGGPMMGKSIVNIDAPVTKLTSGILALPEDEAYKPEETFCIRCGKCLEVCPVGLKPYAIATAVRENDFAETKRLSAIECIECGSCAYTCPAKIPLLDCCKLAKYELKKQK